jgi:hypothetical protein
VASSNGKNRFWSALSRQATRNWNGKIHRQSLMSPSNSTFLYPFSNYATFYKLLQHFSPLFYQYKPHVASGLNIKQLPGLNYLGG